MTASKLRYSVRQTFANWLRNRRKEMGLSQMALSMRCGVSYRVIATYENASVTPGLESVVRFAKVLGNPPPMTEFHTGHVLEDFF